MRQNPAFKIFIFFYTPLLLIGSVVVLGQDKGAVVLALNAYHAPNMDVFFKYLTYLGDGLFLALIIIALLFINTKYAFLFFTTAIGQFLVAFLFKKIIFGRTLRPAIYIGEYLLHFVEGVRVCSWYSFPSGHTITAFSTFFMVALLSKQRVVAVICLTLASGIAISRVYLVQHFLEDVLVGSLIGVLLTMFIYSKAKKWYYLTNN